MRPPSQNWANLQVYPVAERDSLTSVQDILVQPSSTPPALSPAMAKRLEVCVESILTARSQSSAVMLLYGAHLLRNGAALILGEMLESGWVTHLATNGAGTIHDWEYAWLGRSTESVERNVASGRFGAWDETGRIIHIALAVGALRGEGYGTALGRFISEDGAELPGVDDLADRISAEPRHPATAARADLLQLMRELQLSPGWFAIRHQWKQASILASAFQHEIPITVHPGIGYDIIANHPCFNGGVIGRAAGQDFRLFSDSVEMLDGGVVLSVGSAIMGPQVFEKSLSCVNNLRLGSGRAIVEGHRLYVVDLQPSGDWDWTLGEPPKTNPAYYLRFCKSFSRMGGTMEYLQCDNLAFLHNLHTELRARSSSPRR